jgi:16S rRNA (guanine966-N2)-methyltransferase
MFTRRSTSNLAITLQSTHSSISSARDDDGAVTRIVAGVAGGRRLEVPPRGTRPTSERVREALFSAVQAAVDIDGAAVLDLYAGSGALGLEALSRGAAMATFVESDRRAADVLRRNAKSLGLAGVVVLCGTVEQVLASAADRPYDVIMADPPYAVDNTRLADVLRRIIDGGWLAETGVLLLERAARDGMPTLPRGLAAGRTRRYGDTVVHWFERAEQDRRDS